MPSKLIKLFCIVDADGEDFFVPGDNIQIALKRYREYQKEEVFDGEDMEHPTSAHEAGWLIEDAGERDLRTPLCSCCRQPMHIEIENSDEVVAVCDTCVKPPPNGKSSFACPHCLAEGYLRICDNDGWGGWKCMICGKSHGMVNPGTLTVDGEMRKCAFCSCKMSGKGKLSLPHEVREVSFSRWRCPNPDCCNTITQPNPE